MAPKRTRKEADAAPEEVAKEEVVETKKKAVAKKGKGKAKETASETPKEVVASTEEKTDASSSSSSSNGSEATTTETAPAPAESETKDETVATEGAKKKAPAKKGKGKGKGKGKKATTKKATTATTTTDEASGEVVKPPPKKRAKKVFVEEPEEDENDDDEDYWHGWKTAEYIGTEWEALQAITAHRWNFNHLRHELLEGSLSTVTHPLYVFATTEPQLVENDKKNPGQKTIVLLPVFIVIDTEVAPPSKISITSVQRVEEEIVDAAKLKMGWDTWAYTQTSGDQPLERKKKRSGPLVNILSCKQRSARAKNLSELGRKDYEYAIPWIYIPRIQADQQDEVDSVVHIVTSMGGIGLSFEFDWKFDEIDEFVPKLLTEHELDAEKFKAETTELINNRVAEAKQAIRDEREKRKKVLEEMGERTQAAYDALKVYKFYPKNTFPVIQRTPFINRYYGKATQVF
eukprot:TRINITY_DN2383_c0_g1_i1.p1 TRINITY_DN2383_c0_g1~~TRINITY_DN2383_c0_g1_i1.p1  ORF type:complete len:482 (+),score=268.87 TRINITY_DN2383_c0_g1_i1:67-1446(+)